MLVANHIQDVYRIRPQANHQLIEHNDNFLDQDITDEDIHKIIKAMKNTSPGRSGIDKKILKQLPNSAVTKLRNIMNATLKLGYFPKKFKEATLTLIPKTGESPYQVSSYRPISLLEVPGKCFQKILNFRLRSHLEDNNLHHPLQFGFRQSRGTSHALALTTETIA